MNDKQKQLYSYFKDNGLTDLDSNKFFSAYSDPSKSKELYAYLKQNGLTDLDANAFHVAYFSPVKKKSTSASQSVQKKKPTSSATMPSWMQSSLEQSSKKEQPKKPTGPQVVKSSDKNLNENIATMGSAAGGGGVSGVGAISKPKKQEERDFDIYYGYPGQEKNEYRISNGRWQRKYGDKWVEVSNQGSINALTKFFKKQKEISNEEVFTGFPGKEENKYRVSELQNGQKVWEVQRAGQKDYTVIGDQGSIDALNRQFNKKVEYTENAQLKREAEINRRESASEDFKTVTGKLVGKESDEVAAYLRKMYGDRGFSFTPVGFFTDNIRVYAQGTDKSEVFVLDNFRDETDSAEALKLRKFLSENQQLGDYIDLEREEKKKAEEEVVGTKITQEDVNRQMGKLNIAGNQAEFKLTQKQNAEENIIKDLSKQSTDVIEARKTLIRADYDTKQRIDDLTRTAKTDAEMQEVAAIAVANKDEFVKKSGIDNAYLNDLNKSSKSLDQSFKALNSDVEDFNRYIKDNNITQDQLESDPELLAKKDELQVRYDQLIADAEYLDFENKKLPFIQNQNARNAALYFAYNETRGSVLGGLWNGLLRGALGSLQTFRAVDKEGLDNLVETFGSYTTKEFAQSENRNDFSKALLSTAESLGAAAAAVLTGGAAAEGTIASKVLGFIPYFSISYNEIKNEIDEIPGMDKVPWYKKEALSIAYGLGVGYLDKLSTDFQVKGKISNKIGRDLVLRSIAGLPKGATAEAIEMAIASNFKKDIAAGVIKIVAGSVVEGVTEGVQSVYGTGLKEVYDWMNGVDEFDSREWVSQAIEESYYGALGGAIMSTPSTLIKGAKNGFARLDPRDMELARKVVEDSNMRSMVITDIKAKLMSGEITKEEANAQMEAINESMSLFTKIPENLSPEDTSKAMDLIKERSQIESEIKGKDKDLVAARTRRITAINNELKAISENATKETTEQQQEGQAEGGSIQREGVVEGQPEVGQGEGTVGQATTNEADLGNRPVEGRSKEEIDARISELDTMLADNIATIEETGTGKLSEAEVEAARSEIEALKAEVPVEVTAEMPAAKAAPKITETTDTKSYSEALSSAKAELKEEGNGLDLQVSDVSQEEADQIVAEGGKIFMTEDGLAGAYVKKDGYMGGLFKSPRATYKKVAKLLQQARIKEGGRFMDAYATELEKIYIENGFRPVARLKFNEEYAPEGWNAPGSALASKPDVVFFAYDPDGKYKIGDGEYMTDYDAAYEMAKNFDAKTAKEADKLAELMGDSVTVEVSDKQAGKLIDDIYMSNEVVSERTVLKQIENATRALKAILPNVKFVIHKTDDSFRKAIGETDMNEQSSAGAYDTGNKIIHINLTNANARTVIHETFHAIIASKVSTDIELQKLTRNMVKSVIRSLKQSGADQNTIDYLEKFAAGYKVEEQNEEKLSELFALLGNSYKNLPPVTKNIIQRFLERIAKMFGLKPMTDNEVIGFMNTFSGKVEAGTEITTEEFKGGKKVSKPSEGLTVKKQYGNDKVKVEVRYLEQERMDDLIKDKLVREVENLSDLNGQRVVTTSPDDMLVGSIYVNGKEVATGNGGIFFVTKFGDVWANSNAGVAKGLASAINEASRANGGKAYLVLVKGTDAKLVSSPQGVTSSLAVTESMLDAGLFSLSDFRAAIRAAVKDAGGNILLSQKGGAKELKNELDTFFKDVTSSTFEKRGNVLRAIIANLAKSESASKNKSEIIKFLNGDTSKGLGVGVTAKSQSLVDLIANVSAEQLTKGLSTGDVYGVIEINGEVKVFEDEHQSYPHHIKMVDKDGNVSSEKPVLILPKNRRNGKEILTSIEGQTAEELGTGFSGKVGATANMPYGKGIIQDNSKAESTPKAQIEEEVKTLEEAMKPKIKKQHTQKDVKENWSPTPVQSMRDSVISKRNEEVEDAAKKLTKGEITQREYVDIRKKYSPINPIGQLFAPASTEHMEEALGKKSDKLMAPVLDENGNEIKLVGTRLDIPSYLNSNAWVVTIHDGRKENGNVISYRNSVRLKNVVFSTDPRAALNVAAGYMGKSTFGRIMGEMVEIPGNTAEDQGINAQVMVEEIMNDPKWVQVGMNPFRQSWFWNRQTGAPVVSADEVIQIGGLVYAKNAKEVSPDSDEFTVFAKYDEAKNKLLASDEALLDSEGNRIKFQRGNKKASKQAAVIVKKGKEANLSDAGIREYMKRNGYTDRQATDAIRAYNDKKEGIFIDPEWSKLRRAAVIFKRRFLLSRGLMPSSAFASYEESQANTAKNFNRAEKTLVDFNRAMKKVPKAERDKVRIDFDEYVRGDNTVSLPADLKKVADTMRAHIDSISISLINSGVVDEHLAQKIKDNLGSYFTRSYKVHDRANWKNEVEEDIKQKAINLLKVQYRKMAEEEAAKENMDVEEALDNLVTNAINDMLTKSGAENFVSGGKKGSKDLSILKERQDIPLEIRMLMGEYTDPAQNYARTILKMSALAANHHFLTEVKKNGTGVFLFEKNDPRRPKEFSYKIAAEGSETMNPLNGMYTTEEIGKQFEEQSSQLKGVLKWMLETYMRVLSSVKWGKTIGSIMTHAKNVFGNLGFVLLNGHWRVNEMGKAYQNVRRDLWSTDNEKSREYMNHLIGLGIVKQSAGIGELRAMFKDADWDTAMVERLNKKSSSVLEFIKYKIGGRVKKFLEDRYQAEDDFFKIVAYENELSRYSKAMFGKRKTELNEEEKAEVDKVVAEIVKNTYPTYSRIPELVNVIRKLPFVGNFIAFQAESYRTAFNTAALSLDEIKSKNPGIRQIGAQRLVGSLAYMGGKTAILSVMSNAVGMGAVGILGYFTDDDDEKQKENDVRKFVAPWSKNSDLIVLKASNGKIRYVDFSSSDPHGGINKAFNSALMSGGTVDAFINALGSVIEPFVGEEMTTAAILAVKNNTNAYGKPIYNPEDTFYEKLKDISAYMLNVVQPGTVSSARKMYESDSKLNEAVGAATGMRIYDVDVAENFGYSMINYKKRIDDANRIYTSEVYNDEATEKSIAAAKKRAEKAVTGIHAEIYDLYYSAVRLGADEDRLYNNLKSFGGMTKRTINYMFGQEEFYIKNKYPEEEEE
jgi:hypothetical protein